MDTMKKRQFHRSQRQDSEAFLMPSYNSPLVRRDGKSVLYQQVVSVEIYDSVFLPTLSNKLCRGVIDASNGIFAVIVDKLIEKFVSRIRGVSTDLNDGELQYELRNLSILQNRSEPLANMQWPAANEVILKKVIGSYIAEDGIGGATFEDDYSFHSAPPDGLFAMVDSKTGKVCGLCHRIDGIWRHIDNQTFFDLLFVICPQEYLACEFTFLAINKARHAR